MTAAFGRAYSSSMLLAPQSWRSRPPKPATDWAAGAGPKELFT